MPSTHVLIRGHVFTYSEKAPFAVSGESLLGAIEYDESDETTKCHECGEWSAGLGNHIKVHGLTRVDYNQRHGLRPSTPISSPAARAKHSAPAKSRADAGQGVSDTATRAAAMAANHSRMGVSTAVRCTENHNERARCAAQLVFRIQVLAAELGHTPTHTEIERSGIGVRAIKERFGNVDEVMRRAGLTPNSFAPAPSPLPKRFPTKEEIAAKHRAWEEPMPYPKDYFKVDPYGRGGSSLS